MPKANSKEPVLVNGFEPVTINDIEGIGHITHEQAEAMGAMFRAIGRLSDDREVRSLCEHGALQADLQANDINALSERAMMAGLVASGPTQAGL